MWRRFMLPSHKQKRIQRLVRLGVDDGHEADCATENVSERRRERSVRGVLAALDQDSLKVLHDVVQSRGACQGACVVLSQSECSLRWRCAAGVVALMCRHFRWPELDGDGRLKRLAVCKAGQDERGVCVNPYHWSRLHRPDASAPIASAKLRARLRSSNSPDECESAEPQSVTTGGTCQYGSISSLDGTSFSTWCRLVYFERRRRVGQVGGWSVRAPVQHVFYNLPHEDGLALSAVAAQNPHPEPDVVRTRQHIGKGLSLTLESDGVWLYNRSERPLFVSSPTLEPADAACSEAVHKLPSGFSLLVFEPRRAAGCRRRTTPPAAGPAALGAVSVSFAKGWGPRYSRRGVDECPCWMELWFCGPALPPAEPPPPPPPPPR
ncbi:mothers against decapentaplegic homolog 6-like [Pollicipes pollicipes]|uniref:mothers against decapentaplegic homolog 6-like n=1 Tax=Pollicipes pollicipes TaxID=41117 RepID=UPI001884BDE8|nr:mothers against decapentaplegic homolog 6-like [Pollicipes pollicipes]